MAFDITLNNNYIYVYNGINDIFDRPAKDVVFAKKTVDSNEFTIYYRGASQRGYEDILWSDFTLNGVAFASLQAFEDWKNINTGFNTGGGGALINDQSSSGYIDIGDTRIQRGINNTSSISFPVPFADSSYSILLQPIVDDNSGTYSAQSHTLTTTGCSINRNINNTATIINGGFTYSWLAIGTKP